MNCITTCYTGTLSSDDTRYGRGFTERALYTNRPARVHKGGGVALVLTLAGTTIEAIADSHGSDSKPPMESLLEDKPADWGRFGDKDELGRLNLLGSEEAFDGMRAAMQRGRKGIERFTLQLSQTGDVINSDPETPDVIFPLEDIDWPSTDTVEIQLDVG